MTIELVGTGVELRLEGESILGSKYGPQFDPEHPRIEVQCFVEVEEHGRRDKWGGSMGIPELPDSDENLTTALLRFAYDERDANLGGLLGDLRRSGYDVTRWEFYSLPFRVELSARLREFASRRWDEREPRAEGEPITLRPRT